MDGAHSAGPEQSTEAILTSEEIATGRCDRRGADQPIGGDRNQLAAGIALIGVRHCFLLGSGLELAAHQRVHSVFLEALHGARDCS
jgi:hypothetical protein